VAGPFNFLSRLRFSGVRREVHRELRSEKTRRYVVSNPYHAVSVVQPLARGCKASRDIREERFLSADAPTLPLKGCDQSKCGCFYKHHDDRRAGPRRSADVTGTWRQTWHGSEKRRSGGRRVTDI
jgi:hypothetical protein